MGFVTTSIQRPDKALGNARAIVPYYSSPLYNMLYVRRNTWPHDKPRHVDIIHVHAVKEAYEQEQFLHVESSSISTCLYHAVDLQLERTKTFVLLLFCRNR